MEVLEHIKVLLRDQERAFIPGFGGFVKEYVPARIDRSRDLFLPPTCTLSFNTRLAKEDGVLAERLMDAEGKDFESAKRKVQEVANEWEKELKRKKRLELKGIGILHLDDEGKKRFEPDPEPELETSAYGLGAFYLPPVSGTSKASEESVPFPKMEPEEETGEKEPEPYSTGPRAQSAGRKKMLRVAAVLVPLFLLLAFGTVIGIKNSPESAELLNFLPGHPSSESNYRPRSEPGLSDSGASFMEFKDRERSKSPPFSYRLKDGGPEYTVISKNELPEPKEEKNEKEAAYYIVGGCFQIKANARARVKTLSEQGFAARILDRKRKGLHVVAFQGYADRRRAMAELKGIRSSMEDAWLLHYP